VWPGGAKVSLQGPQGLRLISAQWASGLRDTINWPEQATGAPGYVQVISNQQALNAWWLAILVASHKSGVPAAWIAAEMLNESCGDANASVNGLAGAYGLMQLEPGTAQSLPGWVPGARQNPQENLILGAELLAALHTQFGNWRIASAAYYGGAGSVEAAGVTPGMSWAEAAPRLNIVPFASAGNTLTMAQCADNIYATAQWVQAHAPNS
jgi:soluble lytic murein transglycosylase-like protein